MTKDIKMADKKSLAKELFLSGKYQQKEIACKVGVAENTMSRWVKDGKWDLLRASLTASRDSILAQLYTQVEEINKQVLGRPEGERIYTSAETDKIAKLTASINKLETETGIGEITAVCRRVCEFARTNIGLAKSQEIAEIFDKLIESILK